jgi:hypothetical protein
MLGPKEMPAMAFVHTGMRLARARAEWSSQQYTCCLHAAHLGSVVVVGNTRHTDPGHYQRTGIEPK